MRPAWVLLVLFLAGCGSPATPQPGLPVDEKGTELPSVEGYVTDEAVRPIAGATVRLLMTPEINATTDADGYYAIRRPTFEAVETFVTATAGGFTPRTQQIQLSGYRSGRLDFTLEIDPYDVPRRDVLHETDVLACQARTPANPEPLSCEVENPVHTGDPPPPRNIWVVNPEPGLAGFVAEVHWDAETELAKHLEVILRGPVAGGFAGSTGDILAQGIGPSPLRLEIPETVARSMPRWTAVHVEVRLAPGPQSSGISRSQSYDVYASLFYVDPAPPGYRLA